MENIEKTKENHEIPLKIESTQIEENKNDNENGGVNLKDNCIDSSLKIESLEIEVDNKKES